MHLYEHAEHPCGFDGSPEGTIVAARGTPDWTGSTPPLVASLALPVVREDFEVGGLPSRKLYHHDELESGASLPVSGLAAGSEAGAPSSSPPSPSRRARASESESEFCLVAVAALA